MIDLLDVSQAQGTIDWGRVAAATVAVFFIGVAEALIEVVQGHGQGDLADLHRAPAVVDQPQLPHDRLGGRRPGDRSRSDAPSGR